MLLEGCRLETDPVVGIITFPHCMARVIPSFEHMWISETSFAPKHTLEPLGFSMDLSVLWNFA